MGENTSCPPTVPVEMAGSCLDHGLGRSLLGHRRPAASSRRARYRFGNKSAMGMIPFAEPWGALRLIKLPHGFGFEAKVKLESGTG